MNKLWDVYIWPINDSNNVRLVAKEVDFEKAQEVYNRYFDTNIYDAYMIPAGTKLFV